MSMFGGRARWKRGWDAFSTAASAAAAASKPAGGNPNRWVRLSQAAGRAARAAGAGARAAGQESNRFHQAFCQIKPGILDFSPQLRFSRRGKGTCGGFSAFARNAFRQRQCEGPRFGSGGRWQSAGYGWHQNYHYHTHNNNSFWARVKKKRQECRFSHEMDPNSQAFRRHIRRTLLSAYVVRSLKHHHGCALHGSMKEKVLLCGNGGGSWKAEFINQRLRKGNDQKDGESGESFSLAQEKEKCRISCFLARGTGVFYDAARRSISAQKTDEQHRYEDQLESTWPSSYSVLEHPGLHSLVETHGTSHRLQGRPLFTGVSTRPTLPLLSAVGIRSGAPAIHYRLFSSTSSRKGLPIVLSKATWLFKSSAALSYVNLLFRLSVTVIPIGIKRAMSARKIRLARVAAGLGIGSRSWFDIFVTIVTKSAVALPFLLLGAVLLASLERTPITGRWRMLLVSEKEECDITRKVLEVGLPSQAVSAKKVKLGAGGSRDWVAIMRAVLGEEEAVSGTLLGGRILDESDPRVHLVKGVLTKLESGIPHLAYPDAITPTSTSPVLRPVDEIPSVSHTLTPPALSHTLNGTRCQHLGQNNAVLVIDRPESNAFSFGFYGSVNEKQPGVIIVFTGAIDEILKAESLHSAREHQTDVHGNKVNPRNSRVSTTGLQARQEEQTTSPSWLRHYFSSILPQSRRDVSHTQNSVNGMPVTKNQEEALAVLLAHELAHLVLSHTIESYANTALLWPQLEKLGWDIFRVFIYPVTAILGPFVQDAISATVKVGIEESSGLLPALTSSCESRKMESEADLVGLRLLANAGIDPERAIQFWEERLSSPCQHEHDSQEGSSQGPSSHERLHGHRSSAASGQEAHEGHSFLKSHPADEERIAAIREELARWRRESARQLAALP